MASVAGTLKKLRALGKEGTARIYARHGVQNPALGVSYGAMKGLVRSLGVDHELAQGLWDTGVHEARVVATKIADPKRLTRAQVGRWLKQSSDYVVADAVSGLAARAPEAPVWAARWIGSPGEWTSAAGWNVVSLLAMKGRLELDAARDYLERISKGLEAAPNRTRYSMNGALISIGGSIPELTDDALVVARAIGPVEVDHGETGCQTPDATDYIPRMAAHRSRRTRVTGARAHARPRRPKVATGKKTRSK